ncbi:MAG: CBS domain-containing protein [Candidatus Bathyarchaeota archaeon]|nr:CBS domain-containing protein [Candidatus Bathyarchaeota archaeon]
MTQEAGGNRKVSLSVKDIMTEDVVTVDEHASVKEAAEAMNQHEIGCVIVVRKGEAVGILTERDLLKHVIVEGKDANATKVKEIMSSPLEVVSSDTSLEDAVQLMFKKKIKKLPVIREGKLLGLVSLTDIVRCQPALIKLLKSFAATQDAPKSMKKVIDYYIV